MVFGRQSSKVWHDFLATIHALIMRAFRVLCTRITCFLKSCRKYSSFFIAFGHTCFVVVERERE